MVNAVYFKGYKRKMTEEQIKQKSEAEADKVIIGSGMDRASVIHLKHLLVTMYMQGATKATKELEAEVKEWKDKADLWCKTANLKDHNIMINKELEKENAELKEKYVKNITDCDICDTYCNSQLTKAKELLKRCYENYIYLEPLRSEIKQFLKNNA